MQKGKEVGGGPTPHLYHLPPYNFCKSCHAGNFILSIDRIRRESILKIRLLGNFFLRNIFLLTSKVPAIDFFTGRVPATSFLIGVDNLNACKAGLAFLIDTEDFIIVVFTFIAYTLDILTSSISSMYYNIYYRLNNFLD